MNNIYFMQELSREKIQRYMGDAKNYRQVKAVRRSNKNSAQMMQKIQRLANAVQSYFQPVRRAHGHHAPQEC
jgi:hypothetical protein